MSGMNGQRKGPGDFQEYRERYQAFLVEFEKITARLKAELRVGSRGNYRGLDDWQYEDLRWRESELATLAKLSSELGMSPAERKSINDEVEKSIRNEKEGAAH